jgi:hypothetical protein
MNYHEKDAVNLEVAENVEIGGVVVIPKDAPAVGHIQLARFSQMKGGKLLFSVDHVKAVDDTSIRLRADFSLQPLPV